MKTAIMKKILLTVISVIAGLVLLVGAAHASEGSMGKEFYFSFAPNIGNASLYIYITGQQDTEGTVDVAGANINIPFSVQANKVTTVLLPYQVFNLPVDKVSKLTVHVVAQKDVTVYGLNRISISTDGFLALPVNVLGLEYYALSYNELSPSQLVIVGVHDNTETIITPSGVLNSHAAGIPFKITLNRGETYFLTGSDVSGTHINASAPVSVLSGVQCANIPTGTPYCDHIVEMMPPVTTWGKSFLTVPLATRTKGDIFRILASENDTIIKINGALAATLQKGKFFETVLKTRSEIQASAPILVSQYSVGTTFDGVISDPFMMLIPPTEQFLDQYTFTTPETGFSTNFVNVVVPSGEVDRLLLLLCQIILFNLATTGAPVKRVGDFPRDAKS